MGWVSLLLQLFALRRGLSESQSMLHVARELAEKGRRAVASLLATALAALFFFSGLLLAVIELGLQIERGTGPAYSGLMVSATILAGIGLGCLGGASLLGRAQARAPEPEASLPRAETVKDLLEELLVSFLAGLVKAQGKDGAGKNGDPP